MQLRKRLNLFRRTTSVAFVALVAFSVLLCAHCFPQNNADYISAVFTNASSGQETSAPKDTSLKRLPKIIDLFLFNGEFDYLDIKLHEIYHDIDFFAIVESNETFTGMSKPLYFKDNMYRFEKFMDKIHYVQVPPMPADNIRAAEAVWGREHYTRDKAFKMVVNDLHVQEGDWIIITDADEITRPSVLQTMRYPDPEASSMDNIFADRLVSQGGSYDLITFGLRYYRYAYDLYLGTRFSPVAIRYREWASHLERVALNGNETEEDRKYKELLAYIGEDNWVMARQRTRACGNGGGGDATKMDDVGWHCSWCFSNMSQFQAKIDTYGHREYDIPERRGQEYIIGNILNGTDFSGRTENPLFLESADDIPATFARTRSGFRTC
ncbi:hypothetical protein BG000_000095 [Podila horticola]|nr:hypothetical protein BG000_000095 [Podila horticola]